VSVTLTFLLRYIFYDMILSISVIPKLSKHKILLCPAKESRRSVREFTFLLHAKEASPSPKFHPLKIW
jgi:hypothetical protein